MKRYLLFLALGGSAIAAEPAWWTASGTAIKNGAPANNMAPLSGAQLKNVAKKAALYMNNTLPAPGAGAQVNALVARFQRNPGDMGPVTIGQLKAVVKPFYIRLQDLGFNTNQSLINHGSSGWAHDYPWNPATPKSQNGGLASLGQLKWCFSFDLTSFSAVDSDGDGLTDAWENAHNLDPHDPTDAPGVDLNQDGMADVWEIGNGMDANGDSDSNGNRTPDIFEDFDGDGLSNQLEAAMGLNPYSQDSDNDSMPDDYELANDLDPTDGSDAGEDVDHDGYSNVDEFAQGYNAINQMNTGYRPEPDADRVVDVVFNPMSKGLDDTTHQWNETPGAVYAENWLGTGDDPAKYRSATHTLAWSADTAMYKETFHFMNHGHRPLTLHWAKFEYVDDDDPATLPQLLSLSLETATVPANNKSADIPIGYPTNHHHVGIVRWTITQAAPKKGLDDFERRMEEPNEPTLMEEPWLMVPVGGAGTEITLKVNNIKTNSIGTPFTVESTDSAVAITPDHSMEDIPNTQRPITITASTSGEDAQLYLAGPTKALASGIPVLHLSKLAPINYTLRPFKVTCLSNIVGSPMWPAVPKNLPTEQALEDALNDIYEKQMNVHFTVLPYRDISVNYDIGEGQPALERYTHGKPLAANGILDILWRNTAINEPVGDEEQYIYNQSAGTDSSANVSVYFVGTALSHHVFDVDISESDEATPVLGVGAQPPHTCFVSAPGDASTSDLENIAAHEIGHLAVGILGGKGLMHPRMPKQKSKGWVYFDFPLSRESDDQKRLMWFDFALSTPTKPATPHTLLIHDEWMKWRGPSQ